MRRIARKKAIMTGTAAHGNFTEDSTLPAFLRLVPVFTVIVLSTILHTLPLFLIALLKWLLPIPAWRRACAHALVRIAESWIGFNSWLFTHATPTRFQVSGLEALRRDGHYLVLANHRSWVDIVAMQYAFNRRIPFLRFFLKRELIWVPFLGVAWWALDFPFMRRASRRELAKNPDLAASDMLATRRACEKFRGIPVSIMNFVEGTRFTAEKHARQGGPYRHLLRPKAGGVAFVLEAMGDALHAVLDVTIAYPGGTPTMADLMSGRIPSIVLEVRELAIPAMADGSSYEQDSAVRVRYQRWVNEIWADKDARLVRILGAGEPGGA
jgi:1-acyl-sn-glycerol-3-phosphate acyltransferase